MRFFYKVILIILLICFFSALFCQEKEGEVLRNAVAIEPCLIGGSSYAAFQIGVTYEYAIVDQFSILGTVNYTLFASDTNQNISNISIVGYGIRGRLYTYGAAVEGAFIGLGATYGQVKFNLLDGTSNPATWATINLELGYKFIFYNFMNLFVEPTFGWNLFIPVSGYNVTKGGGFGNLGILIGVAF